MKELFLLRSATTKGGNLIASDYSSKLSYEGYLQSATIGKYIYDKNIEFEIIYCSLAKRAVHTAVLAKTVGGIECKSVYDERLYGISQGKLLQIITSFDNSFKKVLIVGHNPSIELLVNHLTGINLRIPHATLVKVVSPKEDWKKIEEVKNQIEFTIEASLNMRDEVSMVLPSLAQQSVGLSG